ncbi:hypothetical protein COU76_04390 [Candidatus Peregrinibacteria bacterium CG10_big_fil_rev_8_21_14_0_10_49_10]|nr:MAG: hypothetical protein COU76_04390 [Candidatus Peregrinibacteria bacterium CG10_big_fil_rev_8_21_14_0_10_49_10]
MWYVGHLRTTYFVVAHSLSGTNFNAAAIDIIRPHGATPTKGCGSILSIITAAAPLRGCSIGAQIKDVCDEGLR